MGKTIYKSHKKCAFRHFINGHNITRNLHSVHHMLDEPLGPVVKEFRNTRIIGSSDVIHRKGIISDVANNKIVL